jgi:acyl-coenzyme A thioesterase PaaI-like protein
MSFLKPVTTGVIICNSKVIQLGGRLAFCASQIVNDSGEIIATSSATLMRLTR